MKHARLECQAVVITKVVRVVYGSRVGSTRANLHVRLKARTAVDADAGEVLDLDHARHRVDVCGMLVIRRHHPKRRHAPFLFQGMKQTVHGRCRRRGRVLRIHGQHDESFHSRFNHFTDYLSQRRIADLHTETDGEVAGTTPARFEVIPQALGVRVPS